MHSRFVVAAAAALLSISPMTASAQYFEFGPGGVRVDDGYGRYERRGGGRRALCRELRQACLYKDQLGERGRGNCREYRETCRGY